MELLVLLALNQVLLLDSCSDVHLYIYNDLMSLLPLLPYVRILCYDELHLDED